MGEDLRKRDYYVKSGNATSDGGYRFVAHLTALVGVAILGYGLLVTPTSTLGGTWIAAIGLSILFSGLFPTELARDRFGLAAGVRRDLSLSFAVPAVFVVVAFVVVNVASFEPGGFETGRTDTRS